MGEMGERTDGVAGSPQLCLVPRRVRLTALSQVQMILAWGNSNRGPHLSHALRPRCPFTLVRFVERVYDLHEGLNPGREIVPFDPASTLPVARSVLVLDDCLPISACSIFEQSDVIEHEPGLKLPRRSYRGT